MVVLLHFWHRSFASRIQKCRQAAAKYFWYVSAIKKTGFACICCMCPGIEELTLHLCTSASVHLLFPCCAPVLQRNHLPGFHVSETLGIGTDSSFFACVVCLQHSVHHGD